MFIFSNLKDAVPKCLIVAGSRTQKASGWTKEEIRNQSGRIQNGELPGERCGHTLFTINGLVTLVGGHEKQRLDTENDNYRWKFVQRQNIYSFTEEEDKWTNLEVDGEKGDLERSCFSSVNNGSQIFICGGNKYTTEGTITKLPINRILTILIDQTNRKATLKLIEINMQIPWGWSPLIAAAPMVLFKNKLVIMGGNSAMTRPGLSRRNGKLIVIDLWSKIIALKDPPEAISQKVKIFGSSAGVMGDHSIIFIGGSLPPPGMHYLEMCYREPNPNL